MRLALLLLLVFFAMQGHVEALKAAPKQELLKKERSLEEVRKQIREEKKGLKEVSEKETDILGELEGISKDLAAKRDEVRAARRSLAGIRKEAEEVGREIGALEALRAKLASRLRARLRAMYKMGRGEAMDVLLSSDQASFGRRHKYLTMIMEMDSELLDRYSATIDRLVVEKDKKAALLVRFEAARSEAASRQREAESIQKRKLALLGEVKGEKARRERVVKELEQAAAELTKLVDRLRASGRREEPAQGSGFAAMKGRLPMPVGGKVVSFYGKVKHPRFKTVTFNNGIIIEASLGEPAKSVYDGKVIYAGWLKGYGQVMIIDHKGGFYTLFAHLSKALMEVGQEAPRGSEVGLVGDTGLEGVAGLYFEIRHRGVTRDPMDWLSR